MVSQSTRKKDNTIKRQSYQTLPSLEEFVLIEQDFVDIEVCRRSKHWWPEHYYLGDAVHFDITVNRQMLYCFSGVISSPGSGVRSGTLSSMLLNAALSAFFARCFR
uniref:hypothetical protein n=1 Tax=Candidatus Electrothrix sp. TaxID=2170559 RepID=UPI004057898C